MTKARENSDYTGLAADIVAGDTAARAGRKNLIINGGMQVSQRGDYTSATTITNGTYYLDRHKIAVANVTGTVQHTDITINGVSKKALRVAATSSATGYIGSYQKTELADIQVGETYTLSCWVRSNNANTRFRVNNIGGANVDGPAFTNDGNWEKVTWTFDSSSTTHDATLWVITYDDATVSVTTGDYIEFTEVQFEVGSVATDFEHRSYGEELALCQRYYEGVWYWVQGWASAANQWVGCTLSFAVPKRTASYSKTLNTSAEANCTAFLAPTLSNTVTGIQIRSASAASEIYSYGFLIIDDEL